MAARPIELRRLTGLRAFAALAVFAFHIYLGADWVPHDGALRFGYTGVTLFFILSGFVLTWSWRESDTVRGFYARRVARIYPCHVVTAAVALVLLLDQSVRVPRIAVVLANLGLVHAWFGTATSTSLNSVSWTLSCEMFFYLGTPLVLRLLHGRRLGTAIAVTGSWSVATMVVRAALSGAATSSVLQQVAYTNPLLRSGDYALGIMLALLVTSGRGPRIPRWTAPSLLALTTAALLLSGMGIARFAQPEILLTPAFACVILTCAQRDVGDAPSRVLHHPWVLYAGRVSFAFYLVHELAIRICLIRFGAQVPSSVGAAATLSSFLLALLAAVALHHAVELPAQRRIVTLSGARTPAAPLR